MPAGTPAAIAVTGTDGRYQLPGLRPRAYEVRFTSGCGVPSYAAQWFSGARSRADATPVTVTPGSRPSRQNHGLKTVTWYRAVP